MLELLVLILILIAVVFVARRTKPARHRGFFVMRCPHCREWMSDSASVCPNCTRDVTPRRWIWERELPRK